MANIFEKAFEPCYLIFEDGTGVLTKSEEVRLRVYASNAPEYVVIEQTAGKRLFTVTGKKDVPFKKDMTIYRVLYDEYIRTTTFPYDVQTADFASSLVSYKQSRAQEHQATQEEKNLIEDAPPPSEDIYPSTGLYFTYPLDYSGTSFGGTTRVDCGYEDLGNGKKAFRIKNDRWYLPNEPAIGMQFLNNVLEVNQASSDIREVYAIKKPNPDITVLETISADNPSDSYWNALYFHDAYYKIGNTWTKVLSGEYQYDFDSEGFVFIYNPMVWGRELVDTDIVTLARWVHTYGGDYGEDYIGVEFEVQPIRIFPSVHSREANGYKIVFAEDHYISNEEKAELQTLLESRGRRVWTDNRNPNHAQEYLKNDI